MSKKSKKPTMSENDESNSAHEETPKSEKRKNKAEESAAEENTATFEDEAPKAKKSKSNTKVVKNGEGEDMLPISNSRYITVRTFKGKTYIDLREHYEKEGKILPGKKGISLSVDQYNIVKSLLDEVDSRLPA